MTYFANSESVHTAMVHVHESGTLQTTLVESTVVRKYATVRVRSTPCPHRRPLTNLDGMHLPPSNLGKLPTPHTTPVDLPSTFYP